MNEVSVNLRPDTSTLEEPRLVVSSFQYIDAQSRGVNFDEIRHSDDLLATLRRDHGVSSAPGATPLVVLLNDVDKPDEWFAGNALGSVAVQGDTSFEHQLVRAIDVLQTALAGLRASGNGF